jgi:hypothetical protein
MADDFVNCVHKAANARGVDFNKGNLYGEDAEPIVTEGRETIAAVRVAALAGMETYLRERARLPM